MDGDEGGGNDIYIYGIAVINRYLGMVFKMRLWKFKATSKVRLGKIVVVER